MCQRFMDYFVDKVIEKSELSHFYLFRGEKNNDFHVHKIVDFVCLKDELLETFIQKLREMETHEKKQFMISLSYFLDFTDKCQCVGCLGYYGGPSPPSHEPCAKRELYIQMNENIEEIQEKLIQLLKNIDLMEIDKYTNEKYFMVRDTTGAIEKLWVYIP